MDPEELGEGFEKAGAAASAFEDFLGSLPTALQGTGSAAQDASDRLAGLGAGLTSAGAAAAAAGAKLDAAGRIRDAQGRFLKVGTEAHAAAAAALGLGEAQKTAAAATEEAGEGAAQSATKVGLLSRAMSYVREGAENLSGKVGSWLSELDPVELTISIVKRLGSALLDLAESAITLTQEKDALRATFDVFTGGAGDALLDGIERMAATLPFTADRVNAWAKSLLGAGIQGDALEASIQAISAATAIMGEAGGAAATGLIKRFTMMAETGQKVTLDRRILAQLAEAGVTAAALAQQLGVAPDKLGKMAIAADKLGAAMQNALISKGGAALARMGDTWASISAKLKEGWEDAFEDLGDIVGPFMSQVRGLASEFFAGSIAGGTLKDTIKAVLTPAFEVATRVVRAMHIAVLEVEIAYLKAAIALRPITSALDKIGISGGIVNVAMYVLTGTAIVLAVVFGALAVAVLLCALPFIVVGAGIVYLVSLISGLIDHFDQVSAAISTWVTDAIDSLAGLATGAAQAADDFVAGLVAGIVGGAIDVVNAVAGLASSAVDAFKAQLGIKSPSRVMREHGKRDVAGGLALGVDEGADKVDASMGALAKPPRGKGGARGGGSGDRVFAPVFNNCVFGGGMSKDQLWDWLDEWWEQQDAAGLEPEGAVSQ